MIPERKVKSQLKKALAARNAWQYWPVSNGMGVHGVPDCLCFVGGRLIGFEVKRPGRRGEKNRGATKLQVIYGEKMVSAGAEWYVVDCIEEIEEVLGCCG